MRRKLTTNAAAVAAAIVGVAGYAGSASAQLGACASIGGTDVISNATPPLTAAGPGETDGLVATISSDTTWGDATHPSPICLHEPTFVTANATLTILPGTVIYGEPRTGNPSPPAVNGSPGTLVITQDGRIHAEGSPNNSIVFTTGAMDNDEDGVCDDLDGNGRLDEFPGFTPGSCPGCTPSPTPHFCDDDPLHNPRAPLAPNGAANVAQWGGVVLLGRAPTNLANGSAAPGGYGVGFVEGLPLPGVPPADAQCGGVEPHDNSGVVRYVSVRHGGDEVSASNELNGFTLCGVGDATIFEYNDVYSNFDDGVEVFGGTVNINHLAVEFVGDDSLDLDWGYQGFVQFVLGIQPFFQQTGGGFGQAGGDKLGEWDGNDFTLRGNDVNVRCDYDNVLAGNCGPIGTEGDYTPWPEGNTWVYNYSGIGKIPNVYPPMGPIVPAAAGPGINMRHGFAGAVVNSLFVNQGTGRCYDPNDGSELSTTGHLTCTDHAGQDLIRMISTSCSDTAALTACGTTGSNNGNAYGLLETGQACSSNKINDASFTGFVQEDPTFDPRGVNGVPAPNPQLGRLTPGGAPYDPRPNATSTLAGIGCGVSPSRGPLDRSASYRGAFTQTAPELWTDGWATLNIAGVLAN
jgi:hypothetical protein